MYTRIVLRTMKISYNDEVYVSEGWVEVDEKNKKQFNQEHPVAPAPNCQRRPTLNASQVIEFLRWINSWIQKDKRFDGGEEIYKTDIK